MTERAIDVCARRSFCTGDVDWDRGMFSRLFEHLRDSWPSEVVMLFFASMYWSLLRFLPDSIDAFEEMHSFTTLSRWGGVEDLFVLNSAVLGWVCVAVLERRKGAAGFGLLVIALPWCLASIGGGFAFALLFGENLTDPVWTMLVYSLVSTAGVSTVRVYWGSIR